MDNAAPARQIPNYTNYLNTGWNILALIAHIISIYLIGRLLHRSHRKRGGLLKKLAPMFKMFLITEWLMTISCLTQRIYSMLPWQDAIVGPWMNTGNSNYIAISSWPTFFLTLDRCLAILSSSNATAGRLRRPLLGISIGTIIFLQIVGTLLHFGIKTPSGLINNQNQLLIKLMSNLLNLCAGSYFLYLFQKCGVKTVKNQVVKFTLIWEFFLGILPSLAAFTFFMANASVYDYTGRYSAALSAVDLLFCSIYYTVVYGRKGKGSQMQQLGAGGGAVGRNGNIFGDKNEGIRREGNGRHPQNNNGGGWQNDGQGEISIPNIVPSQSTIAMPSVTNA